MSRNEARSTVANNGDELAEVLAVVARAQEHFRCELASGTAVCGLTREMYVRYLSFQYHLTRGVQRHFLRVAGHSSLCGRRKLRDFLYRFAIEEEPHYRVALDDLDALGERPLPCPMDVSAWWAMFDRLVDERPFMRLGATCVLENLGPGAGTLGHALLDAAPFLNNRNTRFFQIHFHEELPHGDQIVAALRSVDLVQDEQRDLAAGARIGATVYLRLARWALGADGVLDEFQPTLGA